MARPNQHTFACNSPTHTSCCEHVIVEIPGFLRSHGLQASGNCMRNCQAIAPSPVGAEGTGGTGGPGCGARGRRRGLAGLRDDALSHTQQHSATGVEGARGPGCGARGRRRGLAGLRDDAPSEARGADGERAGRRPRAHQAARPSRAHKAARPHRAQPGPTGHSPAAISGLQAPSGSPTRWRHPPGRAGARNRRRRARGPRPRR